jgi:hypothetical protein
MGRTPDDSAGSLDARLSDVLMSHRTFGTCQCVGFPTDERDTHVLA